MIDELITGVARRPERAASEWIFYLWNDRTEFMPKWQSAYVRKAITPDGKVLLVGRSSSRLKIEKAFVQDQVDAAARLLSEHGPEAAFREIVKRGPPPGLLAFDGDVAVGWCQLTPRDALPWLDRTWRLKRVDDVPVWSLSCLYVRKGYRRQGVTSALIAAALKAAKRAKAPALEAYPIDADETPSASGTGYASTFARAGFKTVARRTPPRPMMRHDLKAIAR